MKDHAAFRHADLMAVWSPMPLCVFTLAPVVEFHHCLGRGQDQGFKKDHPDREMLSSVFNAIPVSHAIHSGPLRDAPDVRRLFLRLARTRVLNAAAAGHYEVTALDRRFLDEIATEWLRSNP